MLLPDGRRNDGRRDARNELQVPRRLQRWRPDNDHDINGATHNDNDDNVHDDDINGSSVGADTYQAG